MSCYHPPAAGTVGRGHRRARFRPRQPGGLGPRGPPSLTERSIAACPTGDLAARRAGIRGRLLVGRRYLSRQVDCRGVFEILKKCVAAFRGGTGPPVCLPSAPVPPPPASGGGGLSRGEQQPRAHSLVRGVQTKGARRWGVPQGLVQGSVSGAGVGRAGVG